MYVHVLESKEVKEFFKKAGVAINKGDSAQNVLTLKNKDTGEELKIWAEVVTEGYGIPGLYFDRIKGETK